jgi:hypothetical protein
MTQKSRMCSSKIPSHFRFSYERIVQCNYTSPTGRVGPGLIPS